MTVSYEGNKIFSFYHEGKQLLQGKLITPRFASVWLTLGCNLRCIYCHYDEANRVDYFADTASMKQLFCELAQIGVESVEFSGGGEPTLHPDCFDLAGYAHQQGLRVGIITNGFWLDVDRCHFFDYIRIGLDAACLKTYASVKGGTEEDFSWVIEQIPAVLAKRESRPRIGLKFMINKRNYSQVEQMVRLSRNLGVDYCHFKAVHFHKTSLSPSEEEAAKQDIEIQKKLYPEFVKGGVACIKPRLKCFMSPIHTVIDPHGDVFICNYMHNKGIGNAFRDGFYNVWYSEKHMETINSITLEDCINFACRWNFYNSEMYDILTQGKYDLSFI